MIFASSSVRVSAVISLLGVMKRPPFVPAEPAKICNADYIRTSVLFQDGIVTKWCACFSTIKKSRSADYWTKIRVGVFDA